MIGRTARTGGATRSVRPAGGGVPASEFRDRTSGASEVNEPAAREGKGAATRSPDMSVATHSASDRGDHLPGVLTCAGKASCLGRRFLSNFRRPGSSWSAAFSGSHPFRVGAGLSARHIACGGPRSFQAAAGLSVVSPTGGRLSQHRFSQE